LNFNRKLDVPRLLILAVVSLKFVLSVPAQGVFGDPQSEGHGVFQSIERSDSGGITPPSSPYFDPGSLENLPNLSLPPGSDPIDVGASARSVQAVPEPSTIALFGFAVISYGVTRRKTRR
jgi:hypothetical protein